MFCPNCKSENNDNAKFCKNCGCKLNGNGNSQDSIQANNNQSVVSDNRNMMIIVLAIVLCAVMIVGALVLVNNNNNESSQSVTVEDNDSEDDSIDSDEGSTTTATVKNSMKIHSGSISTGSSLSDKTYCTVYVGSEHAGENCKISVLYSRDGSNLNHGNIVPKTVDSGGYVSVPSADAFKYYPDTALVTIYDASGNELDHMTVYLATESGTQTF